MAGCRKASRCQSRKSAIKPLRVFSKNAKQYDSNGRIVQDVHETKSSEMGRL